MADLSRRHFLFLTGGAGAAALTDPGRQLVNRLIPYVVPPEKVRPGTWVSYASTCRECPAGCGVHLRHRDGRVTKAEGNPNHPLNRGALCARGQSALQGLYDPDRIRGPLRRRAGGYDELGWDPAIREIGSLLERSPGRAALLSGLQTGSLAEVLETFAAAFAGDRLLYYETYAYTPLREAHRLLFGLPSIPRYRLDRCEFVLSFAADFLETWLSPVEFGHDFGRFHAFDSNRPGRFAYVGPRLSMTAGSADDLILVPPGDERFVALAMLQVMIERGWCRRDGAAVARLAGVLGADGAAARTGLPGERITALARAFCEARGSVALPGPAAGATARDTALAAALLNHAAGRVGETVDFSRPHALTHAAGDEDLSAFLAGLGEKDVLFVHGTNPLFTLPQAANALERVGTVVVLGTLPDETAEIADWVLPLDAPAETWGDYAPYRGLESLQQPAMARLHDTRPAGDVFLDLARAAGRPLVRDVGQDAPDDFRAWLEQRWRGLHRGLQEDRPFADFWPDALRTGGIWQEARPTEPALHPRREIPAFSPPEQAGKKAGLALWLYPSLFFFDGRTANRGWLQEAPDPVSTVTWGSWVDLHPQTAARLGVRTEELLRLETAGGRVEAPVRVTTDVLPGVAAVPCGQGHTASGLHLARNVGVNSFRLKAAAGTISPFPAAVAKKTGGRRKLVALSATQQQHHREILRFMPLAEALGREAGEGEELILPLPEGYDRSRDLYPPHEHRKHRWAMIVDLQRCIGCGACAVACYAENNVPVVGRRRAGEGREMAWLKAVPYRAPGKDRRLAWLPLLCQHCDAAPCEPVCPVFAAVHNEEGLNAQIYNRCIGTRYCSNNCPYKVRRFNWFDPKWESPLELQLNPEVTVRCRGVMEKCTFCVQRIRQAEYRALRENRPLRDGEVVPACQQTCPTGVFSFGDLLDPESRVSRTFREDPRRYQLLKELNTKPAVVYLHKLTQEALT